MTPGDYSQLVYSWKLEGLDTEWSEASTQNEVNYANLAPGNYTFLVKGKKVNGPWGSVKEISMDIASPWWASTGAYLLLGLLVGLLIGLPVYFFRRIKKRENKASRSKFFSNLNQEMGTPLSIVLTSLNNIAEEEGTKNKHRLKNTVSRLKELLEPILNFQPSKFSKTNSSPIITKISLDAYFQELIKDFNPLLRQKHLEIIVNNQWNQEFFYYDADNLNKIFFNLISSAIKYSFEKGKIIINLISTNKGDLKIQVADNGSGLPGKDQKVISDYYRSSKSGIAGESPEQNNLLYVKDFIDKLGGTIVFESSKDQGTTFTLVLKNHINKELEVAPVIKKKILEEQSPNRVSELKVIRTNPVTPPVNVEVEKSVREEEISEFEITSEEIRILIVEGNDELRKVFVRSFRKLGEVFEAKNGVEAFEVASRIIPNAILTDFDMPGMDGISLYNTIKENPDLDTIPIFLMISEKDKLQFQAEDTSVFLHLIEKPVNLERLLLMVEGKMKVAESMPYVNTSLSERNSNLLKGGLDEKFIANLELKIMQNIENSAFTVEGLCEAIGMSSNSLYLKLKKLNGLTPLDFIIRTKLIYAKSLINNGESDLSKVARQSGFQNKDIFFSSFKKYFGFMPGTIMEKNSPE